MSNDLQTAFLKISQMQLSNGGFSWFEGMPDSRFIYLEIVKGFGRLLHQQIISDSRLCWIGQTSFICGGLSRSTCAGGLPERAQAQRKR